MYHYFLPIFSLYLPFTRLPARIVTFHFKPFNVKAHLVLITYLEQYTGYKLRYDVFIYFSSACSGCWHLTYEYNHLINFSFIFHYSLFSDLRTKSISSYFYINTVVYLISKAISIRVFIICTVY